MPLADCILHTFPTITDARGRLSVVEFAGRVPFPVQRVFFIADAGLNPSVLV